MKKLLAILLTAVLLLGLAACGSSGASAGASDSLPTLISQSEYILYQNIFFNKQADDYVNKQAVKEGTFTRLEDRFNGVTRYYVWGYYDNTKCCDWQWEFVPKDPTSLPANGSKVKMTGTLVRDEAALDKYWFVDTELELETAYTGPGADVDMCCMSATLERVQLINMQQYPDDFAGKTVRAYGRILQPNTLQHPYYDGAWTQAFQTAGEVPAIGTLVIAAGKWNAGTLEETTLAATKDY